MKIIISDMELIVPDDEKVHPVKTSHLYGPLTMFSMETDNHGHDAQEIKGQGNRMNRKRTKKGFTLIEIMIVVLIIGVLMAIAVPNFIKARAGSRYQTVKANIKQIEAAKSQFAMEKGLGESGSVAQSDLDPKYIKWPTGPLTGVDYATGDTTAGAVTYDGHDEAWWDTNCGPAAAADATCPL